MRIDNQIRALLRARILTDRHADELVDEAMRAIRRSVDESGLVVRPCPLCGGDPGFLVVACALPRKQRTLGRRNYAELLLGCFRSRASENPDCEMVAMTSTVPKRVVAAAKNAIDPGTYNLDNDVTGNPIPYSDLMVGAVDEMIAVWNVLAEKAAKDMIELNRKEKWGGRYNYDTIGAPALVWAAVAKATVDPMTPWRGVINEWFI